MIIMNKNSLRLITLAIGVMISFSSSADVFKNWENMMDLSFMTRGTHESNKDLFAKASLGHLPENNVYGKEPYVYIAFSFDTPKDIDRCKSNPNLNKIRDEKLLVNNKSLNFEVYCTRSQFGNSVSTEISAFVTAPNEAAQLKEMFFVSNYVKFNGFTFPASGFTKVYKEYLTHHGINKELTGPQSTKFKNRLKEALDGNTQSQALVGIMYRDGDGVKQNYSEAIKWMKKSAFYNEPMALFSLGRANIEGTGVPVNFEQAKEYFKSSCNQGYEPGCEVYQKMNL